MNRGEEPLAQFYDGAFRIAIETQTPIAPMVLINASKLLHRDHPTRSKPGTMTMVFMPPVPVDGYSLDDKRNALDTSKHENSNLVDILNRWHNRSSEGVRSRLSRMTRNGCLPASSKSLGE